MFWHFVSIWANVKAAMVEETVSGSAVPKRLNPTLESGACFWSQPLLASCVLHYRLVLLANIAHTFANSRMENTTNQLEPVGIICISNIWTDDHNWSFSCFLGGVFSGEKGLVRRLQSRSGRKQIHKSVQRQSMPARNAPHSNHSYWKKNPLHKFEF